MSEAGLPIRKVWTQLEEVRTAAGRRDDGGPLRKVAACAVIANPLAGQGFVSDLSQLVNGSAELGTLLGAAARELCGPVESYGKAAIVGVDGEQEHGNSVLTSVSGDAFRAATTTRWRSGSRTRRCPARSW